MWPSSEAAQLILWCLWNTWHRIISSRKFELGAFPCAAAETIHIFLEGKSTEQIHNVIVPADHSITLSKFCWYHSSYIAKTCLSMVQIERFTHNYYIVTWRNHTHTHKQNSIKVVIAPQWVKTPSPKANSSVRQDLLILASISGEVVLGLITC